MAEIARGLGLRIKGIVQGVGFRPFVFRLANRLGLTGYVRNTGEGVFIAVYGPPESLRRFEDELLKEAPPLAKIENVEKTPLNDTPPPIFTVLESREGKRTTCIPPDVATCEACLEELFDPLDRRFRYPFINCTDCGPRFTVIEDLPYDREKTTMRSFKMCPHCLAEYTDPTNRRFHAEPNACPECGPRIWLTDRKGRTIPTEDPLRLAISFLKEGKILALKGLGGFHLACDATNEKAVRNLRARKKRPRKPLAVMVPGLEAARKIAKLSPLEEKVLLSKERPILLAHKGPLPLVPSIAPGIHLIGLMLPYTPLHHLLLREGKFLALVMTSGNLSGRPLCWQNETALRELSEIADIFLFHDRDIVVGIDDSVVRVVGDRVLLIRRARGYVPEALPFPDEKEIIAFGPHLKNTFTFTKGGKAFVSQHLGDLEDLKTLEFVETVERHFCRLLGLEPKMLACDLHPGYLSTSLAEKTARKRGLHLVRVQHHVAHAASVAGEWKLAPPFLALVLDGLGLGPDQSLWGGELLRIDKGSFKRLGHLLPAPQPGGDVAARKPWRMFLSYYYTAFGPQSLPGALSFLPPDLTTEAHLVWQMLEKGLNSPLTTSLGRFLDACAAALGLCYENAYEGEAPARLESLAYQATEEVYLKAELKLQNGHYFLDLRPLFRGVCNQIGKERAALALGIHRSLVEGLSLLVKRIAMETGLSRVVLGGGCFQNGILTAEIFETLLKEGLEVYLPEKLPPNDGGISYGQAVWTSWLSERGSATTS